MRAPGSRSLVAALFGRIGGLFLVMITLVGAAAYVTTQQQINEIYDGQLIVGANVLRALMTDELREAAQRPAGEQQLVVDDALLSPEDRKAFNQYAEWRMFRIWRHDRIEQRSDTGPPVGPPPEANGFSEVEGIHARWRLYTLHIPENDVAVQVGERIDIRHVLIRGIALELLVPFLLLAPAVALLIWWSLRDGLRALRMLIEQLGRRTGRDLSPLGLEDWPRDMHPLVQSINRLLARIGDSVRNERAFIDNAAHQLRTPLAAVKLQAQLIAREADPGERAALTDELAASVDRAAAMTDRLLTLAQLDARSDGGSEGDLRAETVAALADLTPLAARRNVGLAFHAPTTPLPSGDPVLLRLIASNLIENALNHAPRGTEVAITLALEDDHLTLAVVDAGPGVPPDERDKVVQRFYRSQASRSGRGAGLGLAIVSEAVRLLAGRLDLRGRADGQSGLDVQVRLPALRPHKA